jgi:hypothetical protein
MAMNHPKGVSGESGVAPYSRRREGSGMMATIHIAAKEATRITRSPFLALMTRPANIET